MLSAGGSQGVVWVPTCLRSVTSCLQGGSLYMPSRHLQQSAVCVCSVVASCLKAADDWAHP